MPVLEAMVPAMHGTDLKDLVSGNTHLMHLTLAAIGTTMSAIKGVMYLSP